MTSIPVLELVRLEENHRFGTFGVLKIDKQVFCVTLERPDIGNRRNISCIPVQQYLCCRIISPRFGPTFEICDVPDRTHILIHPGNSIVDTLGCILLAAHFGLMRTDGARRCVLNSGATFRKFMGRMQDHDQAHLTVTTCY